VGRPQLAAVLLDRDGTINVKAPEGEYVSRPQQMRLLPGAAEAIRTLNQAGVPVVIVTNQRGIALGRMTERDLAEVHDRLRALLRSQSAWIEQIFYCPHDKGACRCRKPGTLMLDWAREYLGLADLRTAVMIGDSPSDIVAGRAVGARTVRIGDKRTVPPESGPVAATLLEAVGQILGLGVVPAAELAASSR